MIATNGDSLFCAFELWGSLFVLGVVGYDLVVFDETCYWKSHCTSSIRNWWQY